MLTYRSLVPVGLERENKGVLINLVLVLEHSFERLGAVRSLRRRRRALDGLIFIVSAFLQVEMVTIMHLSCCSTDDHGLWTEE